jgi:hypothetical protein
MSRQLFLTISNNAGGLIPTNSEHLFSYLFYTTNGIYAVTFNEEPSTYGTARIELDSNKCLTSSVEVDRADIHGHWLNITDVDS